jgi:hypothetical protein
MAIPLQSSMFGILSWLKDHQVAASPSLDELAVQFNVSRDLMQKQLQSLQRYECIKRGGRANADWSITDQGLLRLAAARFTPSGGFFSQFDPTVRTGENSQDPARPVTMIHVPQASGSELPDPEDLDSSPNPAPGQWRTDFFR